jgi:hypothetical protein
MRHPTETTFLSNHRLVGVARLSFLALGLGLALSACSNSDTHAFTTAGPPPPPVSLEATLDAMLRPSSATAAETFLSTLPHPLEANDRNVANPHDRRLHDTVRTLRYDGLALTVYRVRATNSRFPVAVLVTSPAYRALNGLQVGLAARDVVAILGEPTAQHDATWIYQIHTPLRAPYELTVRLHDGRVQALRWAVYLD